MLARLCSKSFKLSFSSTWTKNFQMQAGFRKGRGTREQITNICWIIGKAREFKKKKKSTSVSLTMLKALTMWSTTNGGKFLKRWEYQTTLPASWETCVQVKKQQIEPQIEQWTGSKMGQEYFKAVLQPCLFNLYAEYLMWNNGLDEAHLESRLLGEISTTSDRQMLPL